MKFKNLIAFCLNKILALSLASLCLLAGAEIAYSKEKQCSLYLDDQTEELWADVWKNFARRSVAHPDFKYISDLIPRPFTFNERQTLISSAKLYRKNIYNQLLAKNISPKNAEHLAQKAFSRRILHLFYEFKTELKFADSKIIGPRLELTPPHNYNLNFKLDELNQMQEGLEDMWPVLVRKTNPRKGGSLIKVSNPILIAGGRFREGYYWDTFFGSMGLMAQGRWQIPMAQLDNFVELINTYGLIPNGLRTYYLGRSQPPVVAMLARLVYDGTRNLDSNTRLEIDTWLVQTVLPALKKDYENFWMKERWDQRTGLNFYSDKYNQPRPERHSHDDESQLGKTYRDVRAEAESGQDHTELFQGQASRIANVSLNSFLYSYEKNLAWLATFASDQISAAKYERAADIRRDNMTRYLWNPSVGVFQNYHLDEHKLMPGVSGDIFSTLFTSLATTEQAKSMVPASLALLELEGGIAASTLKHSDKQWDGVYGWAPYQMMAIQGLNDYGYTLQSRRIALKWLGLNLKVFLKTNNFYEKLDLEKMKVPFEDGSKYPTQTGFLWTNGSIVWILRFLGFNFHVS